MKLTFIILATLCLVTQPISGKPADHGYLSKQKKVYELFWHVDQPYEYFPDLAPIAYDFDINRHVDGYEDQAAVKEFISMKDDMLPRRSMFSIMDPDVGHQAAVLFRVLYSAKTFDLFYNTAVWSRFNMNENMFIYSLSVAVIHRKDTKFIRIPPMYEVVPNYYFNNEVIQKAQNIAMGDRRNVEKYFVTANYSGWFVQRHIIPENKLSYFSEDVGLNAFYFLLNHEFPFFMYGNETSVPHIRGDYYFFVHKQLLARYYLERLSNHMGRVEHVSLSEPIQIGYYPTMHYRNGFAFPERETGSFPTMADKDYLLTIKNLHTRIATAIDVGYVLDKNNERVNIYTKEGINVLGNIVQGNADSVNVQLYGHLDGLLRRVLGYGSPSKVKYQFLPSALEIYSTSMRDPMFFNLYTNILSYYQRYKENIPMYTKEELACPGVKIESVEVTRLHTFFEKFESLLNNAVSIRNQTDADNTLIIAEQKRLNHTPFTYKITVNSMKKTKVTVRVFLGPRYDEFGYETDLEHHYMNFVLLDVWHVELDAGTHTKERDSRDFIFAAPDEPPSYDYYNRVKSALENNGIVDYSEHPYGFPRRLQLPKGKSRGMPYKLFTIVSPYDETDTYKWNSPVRGTYTMDNKPLGFPLDRPINPLYPSMSNINMLNVFVYHTDTNDPQSNN
ncbi:hexamerin 70b [Xylocopa sonorina]|uniref:hexamerin 70b n=1 Tax=Xylocopa sonorina TaxID=1818115 RepID=UPI00403AB866